MEEAVNKEIENKIVFADRKEGDDKWEIINDTNDTKLRFENETSILVWIIMVKPAG